MRGRVVAVLYSLNKPVSCPGGESPGGRLRLRYGMGRCDAEGYIKGTWVCMMSTTQQNPLKTHFPFFHRSILVARCICPPSGDALADVLQGCRFEFLGLWPLAFGFRVRWRCLRIWSCIRKKEGRSWVSEGMSSVSCRRGIVSGL